MRISRQLADVQDLVSRGIAFGWGLAAGVWIMVLIFIVALIAGK